MHNLHPILPKCHFPFFLNCVGKMGNGKGLGNLFLCTENFFWFSIWKYILVLKYPMFFPVVWNIQCSFQIHCTIFSRLKTPSNLNCPVLGHFPLHHSKTFRAICMTLHHNSSLKDDQGKYSSQSTYKLMNHPDSMQNTYISIIDSVKELLIIDDCIDTEFSDASFPSFIFCIFYLFF